MSWIDTLDRLITDSWMASREESAAMLDSLLALSLAERWDLFAVRDSRLMFLSDEDYAVLFNSLNAHALIANTLTNHGADGATTEPVTEEATSVLPEIGATTDTDLVPAEETAHTPDSQHHLATESATGWEAHGGLRGWWRSRQGVRWLTLAGVTVTGLILVGAFLTVIVLYLLPGHTPPADAPPGTLPGTLIAKLDEVERDQSQLARRLIQVDNRIDDLAANVTDRINATQRAVRLTSALDQLQAAIDRGDSYGTELERVAPAFAGNAALTATAAHLATTAASGVPSLPTLRLGFDELVPRLGGFVEARDGLAPRLIESGQEPDVLSRLFGWIGSGFGLIESREAKRFHTVLAGIRAGLGLGNLASAVKQVEELHAYPAALVTPWLAAARLRLDADNAVAALRQGVPLGPRVAPEK